MQLSVCRVQWNFHLQLLNVRLYWQRASPWKHFGFFSTRRHCLARFKSHWVFFINKKKKKFLGSCEILNWWLKVCSNPCLCIYFYNFVFIFYNKSLELFHENDTHLFVSDKHCHLCSFGQNCFSDLPFLPHLILPQKYFLFRKGTVTSFCRLCIADFAEFLPLPKPQKYQMALSRGCMYWTTGSLWMCWRLSLVEEPSLLYVWSALTVDLRTLSVIRMPSWEHVVELWAGWPGVDSGLWHTRAATQLGEGMCGSHFASRMVLILFLDASVFGSAQCISGTLSNAIRWKDRTHLAFSRLCCNFAECGWVSFANV